MIWALKDNQRIEATPETKAVCPVCNGEVISKCGEIKVWHWAHKNFNDCDSWGEEETEWHRAWKNEFPKEQQEVVLLNHRADIQLESGLIIELQNSSISPEEIQEREAFYRDMLWLLNGVKFAKNLLLRVKSNYFTFRWKSPPKSWWLSNKKIFIDLNPLSDLYKEKINNLRWKIKTEKDYPYMLEIWNREIDTYQSIVDTHENNLFIIEKIYPKCPCGGWGRIITKEEFLKKVKDGANKD